MKNCPKCSSRKSLDEFGDSRSHADGKFPWCRLCKREYDRRRSIEKRTSKYSDHARYRYGPRGLLWRARQRARRNGVVALDPASEAAYSELIACDPCSYCGQPAEAIDHIQPTSQGGEADWWNLTASCKSCNSSKKDRKLLLWLVAR